MLVTGRQPLSSSEPCESTWCEKTCSAFSCPDDYSAKTEAALLKAPSTEKCCEASCCRFSCPRGFIEKPSGAVGFSTDACCDATCTACPKARGYSFRCPRGSQLRGDADSIIAGSAQLAPERCCESTYGSSQGARISILRIHANRVVNGSTTVANDCRKR